LRPSRNPIARTASSAISDSSAQAEAFARDNRELCGRMPSNLEAEMKRTPIRVEPISTYLERRRKGPIYPVIVAGESVYVSGLPPFDPQTGEIKRVPFARQSELVLEQMRLCLETAGSSLDRVLKCNVYCTPDESHFGIFNEIYSRYFPADAPARIFLHVPSWPGPFDIEIDCVAAI
jgi:2-iminobutanoate/2-iminopropanoate deaminase